MAGQHSREPEVAPILERIRDARNFDFRHYKRPTLLRRIERRMVDRRCRTLADYARLLDREPPEFDALISAILIKVTAFFRDPEAWETLSSRVIPELLAHKRAGDELRVSCASCAT